jgi:hypothetical protein
VTWAFGSGLRLDPSLLRDPRVADCVGAEEDDGASVGSEVKETVFRWPAFGASSSSFLEPLAGLVMPSPPAVLPSSANV